MINTSITKVAPYPASMVQPSDGVRRLAAGFDREDESTHSINRPSLRRINALGGAESTLNHHDERSRFKINRSNLHEVDENTDSRLVSNAQVLMQLINEMGGSGSPAGPGRIFDIVI